jgi:NAD(P)-dependent dehydrogenase (short-subunit alcohol dehydrogenase family)
MPIFLITGASQGIGAAIAREFAKATDAHLVLTSRNERKLNAVAEECQNAASVTVIPCDLADAPAVGHMGLEVVGSVGVPDVVVNNAGVFKQGNIVDTTLEDFRLQLDVNLVSAFLVTKAFLPSMIDRGSGMFVFMASVASIRAYPAGAAYCVAKHGLLGLARSLREDTRESGIRVTTVMPGATWTPSWAEAGPPEERLMPAEDIAVLVGNAFRLSDRSVVEEIVVRPQLGDL